MGRGSRPVYTCSVCESTWSSKKKSGLPQRCPRCKSKLWNKSFRHNCGYDFDAAAYDRIIFGFPVWASNVTPPIRTFIKENDLSGKRIAAFACQSGAGAEKAFGRLKAALGIEKLEAELVLIDPKEKPSVDNEQKIKAFCEELMDQ